MVKGVQKNFTCSPSHINLPPQVFIRPAHSLLFHFSCSCKPYQQNPFKETLSDGRKPRLRGTVILSLAWFANFVCCVCRLANPSPPKVLGNLRVVLNLRQALSLGNLTWPTHLLLIYQVQVGWVLATWDNLISAAPLHRLPYELHQAGSGAPVKPLSRIILWTPGFPNFHVAHILKIPQISQIHEAGISAFLQRAWLLVASHILRTVLHFRLRGSLSAPVESEPPSGPHFFGSSLPPHWSTI